VPEQLTQVILSVLDNALRVATMRVTCAVDNKSDAVRLRITDDGPGIPLEMRDRVFEPFFTTRRSEGAVGLGLSLARAVAVDYGGTLSVSAPIGGEPNGACLVLQLPKMKSSHGEGLGEPDSSGAKTITAGRRVLVVDDEADLLDLLKTALYMRGYLVDAVGTGMDALAKLGENSYDAAVIDFQLTGSMSGGDVHDHIIKEYPQLAERVFFITADTMNYQTHLSLQGTRRPVLEKPFLMADFIAELEKLFA
jgi:two-component system NtrC family sensor kinase